MNGASKTSPLVIIALDAGDPTFIQQWTQAGYLPTIQGLMQRGCWGQLGGPEQLCEWGIWTSLLSGLSRSRHGFYYFRQLHPGTYDLRLFSAQDAEAQPFWSHLQGRDKHVAIIDAPDSEIVPGLPGVQLVDWATRYLPQRTVHAAADPPQILQEARQVFGPQITVSDFDPQANRKEDERIYRLLVERIEKKGRLCRHLLKNRRSDLVVMGFYESHDAAHRFWDYRAQVSSGTPEESNVLAHAIRAIYQAIDRQIGLVLAELPHDANVVVLSCFGMAEQFPTTGLIDAFLQQLGYQVTPTASAEVRRPTALLRRALPHSWRVALSRRFPVAVQERQVADRFRHGTDWTKTTAFAIPSLYTSFVRVNLREREPQGYVSPGKEYNTLLAELERHLQQIVDPHTGAPAVERVDRTVDVFRCATPSQLPDLFVHWKPTPYFIDQVVHPHAHLTQQKPGFLRGSSHSQEGFFAAAGPAFRGRGDLGSASVLDLAPTFLTLLHEAVPPQMLGQVIEAMGD